MGSKSYKCLHLNIFKGGIVMNYFLKIFILASRLISFSKQGGSYGK